MSGLFSLTFQYSVFSANHFLASRTLEPFEVGVLDGLSDELERVRLVLRHPRQNSEVSKKGVRSDSPCRDCDQSSNWMG